jgi:signal transduction histidine kinase
VNRLATRLVLSHLLVAVLGGLATFLVVRLLTPVIVDRMGMSGTGPMTGAGGAAGQGALHRQVSDAVTQALVVGLLVGAVAAAVAGVFAASRLVRPLRRVGETTRQIAAGRYDVRVERPAETELAELADDVNTLGRALADTETRRTRLLGEVAHEMRTPLTVIDGHVEAMIDGVLPTTPEELATVSDEVRRLRRLSDDLSALSRAEEGRLALVPRPVDLATLAVSAAERLRPQADDAGLRLATHVPVPVPVLADPERVAQVVTNLVGNAIRATGPDGHVGVAVTARDGWAVLEVADSGEGLAPEDLERVFERFYRVGGRRGQRESGGSGIGLTIARGIVRAHGGDLTASSPGPGQGATFTARLPLAPAHGAPPAVRPPAVEPPVVEPPP